jgi:hypothetical protein
MVICSEFASVDRQEAPIIFACVDSVDYDFAQAILRHV